MRRTARSVSSEASQNPSQNTLGVQTPDETPATSLTGKNSQKFKTDDSDDDDNWLFDITTPQDDEQGKTEKREAEDINLDINPSGPLDLQ